MQNFPKRVYVGGVGHTVNSAEQEKKLLAPAVTEQSADDGSESVPEKKAKKAKK